MTCPRTGRGRGQKEPEVLHGEGGGKAHGARRSFKRQVVHRVCEYSIVKHHKRTLSSKRARSSTRTYSSDGASAQTRPLQNNKRTHSSKKNLSGKKTSSRKSTHAGKRTHSSKRTHSNDGARSSTLPANIAAASLTASFIEFRSKRLGHLLSSLRASV